MNITILTDAKVLSKAITAIGKLGAKLDESIHAAAVSTLYHAEQHGDVTMAARLVLAMPQSSRRKALILWLQAFGPLKVQNGEDGKFAGFTISKGKKARPFDVDGAMATPFWDFTKERNPAEFTIEALVSYVQRKLKNAVEQGKLDQQGLADARVKLSTVEI